METRTNLDKWLYLVHRIEEHREEKAVKDLQKLYKKLIKDLRKVMGNVYADYADPATGKLTYEALHRQGLDARLLEEVAANVASVTADEGRIIRETVEQTYANCYSGMVQAVQNAVDNEELHEAFAAVEAVKPEVIKAAVNNPVHGLTLSDQLEKNRADIIWGIKQAVGVGLSEGDNYSTMARRIQKELIGPDGAGGSYYKAVRIARTEAHRVREEGNLDAAQNLMGQLEPAGITMMKTWHTMKDERVRPSRSRKTKSGWKYSKSGKYDHQKMEGVQVPINEEFELPSGAKTQAPGKSGVAGEDINCRCFLSYDVVKKERSLQVDEADSPLKKLVSTIQHVNDHEPYSIENIKAPHGKALLSVIEKAPDALKKCTKDHLGDILVVNEYFLGKPHTNSHQGTMWFNLAKDSTDKRGKYCGVFHEMGHSLDIALGRPSGSQDFYKALKKDFETHVKKIQNLYGGNILTAYDGISEELFSSPIYHSISDLCVGLSKGKCRGPYAHEDDYYSRPQSIPREAFAHFYEATIRKDSEKIELIKEYFPSSYEMFLGMF